MCKKAEEIQNIRQADDCVDRDEWWQPGDFIFNKDEEYIFTVCGVRHCAYDTGYFNNKDSIWLPRQDQLQEMIRKDYKIVLSGFNFWESGGEIAHLKTDNTNIDIQIFSGLDMRDKFASMEQLWLAFVMQNLYRKVWDGNNWI